MHAKGLDIVPQNSPRNQHSQRNLSVPQRPQNARDDLFPTGSDSNRTSTENSPSVSLSASLSSSFGFGSSLGLGGLATHLMAPTPQNTPIFSTAYLSRTNRPGTAANNASGTSSPQVGHLSSSSASSTAVSSPANTSAASTPTHTATLPHRGAVSQETLTEKLRKIQSKYNRVGGGASSSSLKDPNVLTATSSPTQPPISAEDEFEERLILEGI